MIADSFLRLKLFALSFLLTLATSAQVTNTLSYRRYTTQDGLPQMQTETLFQDARGYIYVGTLSGFVRFDGRTFTPFLTGHRWNIVGFMETNKCVSALGFRQQWFIDGDELNLNLLDPQDHWLLNNFNATDLPNGYVLFEDEEEQHRWIGKATGTHGKAQAKGEKESDIKGFAQVCEDEVLDKMTPDRKLFFDSSTLYVPTEDGLFRLLPDGEAPIPLGGAEGDFFSLCRQGNTLYAFAQDGIYSIEDDSVRLLTPFDEWQADYGLFVRTTHNGTLLIADSHSLFSYDGTSVTKLAGGFNLIKAMLVDRWDRLWLATYQGVYCFFNRHFINHTLTDNDDIVRGIGITTKDVEDSNIPVMGTLNGKIIRGNRIIYDNPDDYFQPCAAVIDSCVYLAGRSDVACIRDTTVRWLQLPFDRYQFVSEAQGRLIVGTRQIIAAYDPQTNTLDTLTAEIRHPWCAAADKEGRLWVGSTFGLFCIENLQATGSIRPMIQMSPSDSIPQKLIITTMEADQYGAVFFASCDSLFLIRNGEVQELNNQMPQLNGHEVRSLHVSPKGFLVVAAIDGLFVCRITNDYHLTNICFFNHLNGFTIVEPLMARMAEEADGTVWLCGLEQMTSFRPAKLVADAQVDTFITPPLRWWQHWWVWVLVSIVLMVVVWLLARWIEKRHSRRKLLRVQRQKQEREQLIRAIREEAMKADNTLLAQDIVKMTNATPAPQRLTLRTVSGTMMVNSDDIVYLKADGNYTQLVTFHSKDIVLMGIGAIAKLLDMPHFVRADRSTLVNITYISRLNAAEHLCIFRSPDGIELETTLLTPAFKRLAGIL